VPTRAWAFLLARAMIASIMCLVTKFRQNIRERKENRYNV